jgi:hypothetical protein
MMLTTNPIKAAALATTRIIVRNDPGSYMSIPSANSPTKIAAAANNIPLAEWW